MESKHLLRSISTCADSPAQEGDSTYLFVRPEQFGVSGLLGGSIHHQENPDPKDFASLTQSAPLTIELTSEVVNEIREAATTNQLEFDSSQVAGITTDFGSDSNITLKLSDYKKKGYFDEAFNSDNKFTEINNDAGKDYLAGWCHAYPIYTEDPNGNHYSLDLGQIDHDNFIHNYNFDHTDPTTYVEDAGESTVIEPDSKILGHPHTHDSESAPSTLSRRWCVRELQFFGGYSAD